MNMFEIVFLFSLQFKQMKQQLLFLCQEDTINIVGVGR